MEVKLCSSCNGMKPLEQFYRTKRSKDGRQPRCKVCMRESYNSSRGKKKDHYNSTARKRRNSMTEKWRAWKSEQGCKYCNETFGPCLHLHHLVSEEKEAAIACMVAKGTSWERIMKEAEKGIVVCGNCHTKIHYGLIKVTGV